MGRNGKIAQLPKTIREQLNNRLDNGEQGTHLVAWLNTLPETQAVIAAHFDGKPISEENLSQWKKYGYRRWQAQQERLECVQQLRAEAAELGSPAEHQEIKRHLSDVLTAELARALQEIVEQTDDPQERLKALARLADTFARLRREETHAAHVQIARERLDREVAKEDEKEHPFSPLAPLKAYLMQQSYIAAYTNGYRHDVGPSTPAPLSRRSVAKTDRPSVAPLAPLELNKNKVNEGNPKTRFPLSEPAAPGNSSP